MPRPSTPPVSRGTCGSRERPAAALFVLLAVEGVTILRIHDLLTAHVFVGIVIAAFVVTKLASVGYRFVRYYVGDRRMCGRALRMSC